MNSSFNFLFWFTIWFALSKVELMETFLLFFHCVDFLLFCWLHNTTTQQKAIKKNNTNEKHLNKFKQLEIFFHRPTNLFFTLQFNFFALFFKYSFTFEVLFVTLLFCIYFGLCLSFIFRISFANIFHYIFFEEYIHPSIHHQHMCII